MTRILALLAVILALSTIAYADGPPKLYGPYLADVMRVVDGDTVWARVYHYPDSSTIVKVRLEKIDTPEKRGIRGREVPACEKVLGYEATEFTRKWLEDKPQITVSNVKIGVYARRVIGEIGHNGVFLRQLLMENGHARDYVPKVADRKPWCSDD